MMSMFRRSTMPNVLVSLLLFVLTALIAAERSSAVALPQPDVEKTLMKRDVWAPEITSPSDMTVWRVGDTVQVTW